MGADPGVRVDDAQRIAASTAADSAGQRQNLFGVATPTRDNSLARGDARRRGRPRTVTALDDRDWLIRQYQQGGRPAADLADEVGCSPTLVFTALRRHGIPVRPPGGVRRTPMPERLRDDWWLRGRYDSGASIRVIATELGVSPTSVARALRRAGIARRAVGAPGQANTLRKRASSPPSDHRGAGQRRRMPSRLPAVP